MKIFIKRSAFFFFLVVVLIETGSFLLKYTNLYLINYPGSSIYLSIKKSKKKNSSKILLLGDSVGNQLFSNKANNEGLNSLATNQAISIVGQYLLLNNYLSVGNTVDKVILFYSPFSFRNNLNQVYTYHYFLKPFYNPEYNSLFSSAVIEQIRKIPYNQFVQVPHIFVTSWAPNFSSPDYTDFSFLSPISNEYLIKIKELSIQYDFDLDIWPTPTSIEKKKLIDKMNLNESAKCNLEQEFKNYFAKIVYLDSTEFSDGTHLINPEIYSEMYKTEFLK